MALGPGDAQASRSSSPLVFRDMLSLAMAALKQKFVLALVLLASSACGKPAAEVFVLDGRTYSVPSEQVTASNREPHTFVRIKNPEKPYELVYDSRAQGAQHGPGVPRLFSINDEDQSGVDYYRGSNGTIVCRKAVAPKGGCGVRLNHGGVEWTVLFPAARLSEAPKLERDALALLDAYAT